MPPTGDDPLIVEEVRALSDEVVAALHALVPQLSSSATLPTEAELGEIVASPASILLVARLGPGGPVVGSLTLAVFRLPTGMRAWIEDVVVDDTTRGRGVGSALVRAALDAARRKGCRTVDLTSRPSRLDANRLYVSLGFVARETNVYRYEL
ncbi:MAG: GNAT family N-acetyltransferase [Acidimicrobiales bacterium]